MSERLQNYIDGSWQASAAGETLKVMNPASAQVLVEVPLSPAEEVNKAAEGAAKAFAGWRRTPVGDRIVPMFKLRELLVAHREDLAQTITDECGKRWRRAAAKCNAQLKTLRRRAACQ